MAARSPFIAIRQADSIFRLTNPAATSGTGLTQFGRAMTELDIEITRTGIRRCGAGVCANSPQAKGRVERVNQTLQDRLVKELRLRGISDPERANTYLPEFMADFNRRFARPPANPADAHRPLLASHNLARIFTVQTPRTISKNLTLQHDKVVYQLSQPKFTRAFRGAQVLLLEDAQGTVTLEYLGRPLAYTLYQQQVHQAEVVPSKLIAPAVEAAQKKQQPNIPGPNHPWRRYPKPSSKDDPADRATPLGQPPPAGGG